MQENKCDEYMETLQHTIKDFLDDLKLVFNRRDEKADIDFAEFFYKRMHMERIMDHAIKKLYPHQQKIKERDIEFFKTNLYIFAGLPEDRISYYKNSIDKRMSQEDLDVCWEYFDTMLVCVEGYQKARKQQK